MFTSAGVVVSPSLTFEPPSDVSAAGSIAVAEEGDDNFLNVSAAGSVAAVEVEETVFFLNLFTMLDDTVPDTFFVIEDVFSLLLLSVLLTQWREIELLHLIPAYMWLFLLHLLPTVARFVLSL